MCKVFRYSNGIIHRIRVENAWVVHAVATVLARGAICILKFPETFHGFSDMKVVGIWCVYKGESSSE